MIPSSKVFKLSGTTTENGTALSRWQKSVREYMYVHTHAQTDGPPENKISLVPSIG